MFLLQVLNHRLEEGEKIGMLKAINMGGGGFEGHGGGAMGARAALKHQLQNEAKRH